MKRLIVVMSLIILAAGLYGLYLYQKKPLDTHETEADYTISSADLVREFTLDEKLATSKFADKIVAVTGAVKEIERSSLTVYIDASDPLTGVSCSFYVADSAMLRQIHTGDRIAIKGKCVGKLADVVLNNCTLQESKGK